METKKLNEACSLRKSNSRSESENTNYYLLDEIANKESNLKEFDSKKYISERFIDHNYTNLLTFFRRN
jgi:hypothetical protein